MMVFVDVLVDALDVKTPVEEGVKEVIEKEVLKQLSHKDGSFLVYATYIIQSENHTSIDHNPETT